MALPFLSMTGRMVADGELRYTPAGKAVLNGTLACSDWKKVNEEWVEGDTIFLNFTLWKDAEPAAEVLLKGVKCVALGKLRQRSFDAKDGTKRTVYELAADTVAVVPAEKNFQRASNISATADPFTTEIPF